MAATTRSLASKYDVFLNFRGEDTRHGFTGNLYKALHDRGIYTFNYELELLRGEKIVPALSKAIQESRIAITVLSENYAYSSFCLDELVTILDYKSEGLLVIPVFYKVDPYYVSHQRGSYGEAMAKHEKRFESKMEKLQKWRTALHQVADLSGYHFEDGDAYEFKFIESIVEELSRKISRATLPVGDYQVGLESQVTEVMKLLDVGSHDGVHIIGIHGIGGLGKTTLALAVYNLIALQFDESCFLENVREESNKHGLKHLQSIIISKLLGEKDINLTSWQEGASMIQSRLRRKKVLLILDDVNKREQLKAFVRRSDWFGPGSRVIITTRDKHILKYHEVERTYEVKVLNQSAALQLLKWNAFKREKIDPSYEDVLNRVVAYASGLPLALEVIGSALFEKTVAEWESAVEHYKRIPSNEIQEILKVSFDALEEEQKNVFLDIAYFLKGYKWKEVDDILRALYGNCKYHIAVLVEKSLIKHKRSNSDTVEMHDLIQDMGREIGRQRSPEEPWKCKRLWSPKDTIQVLKHNTGTSKIEIICLDCSISEKEETVEWNENAFMKMENLKILIIRNGKFSKAPSYFPEGLRVLEWHRYPSNCLPSNFNPNNLVICNLPDSSMTSFEFHGSSKACLKSIFSSLHGSSKKLGHLTVLNFDWCKFLTQIPDVSDLPNLRELSFQWCESLVAVDESIGFLKKLKILNAAGCRKLTSFPPLNLTSLETLELSHCSSLEYLPEILGKMENIRELSFQWCESLVAVDESIGFLKKLKILNAAGCRKLTSFPPLNLTSLETLELSHCSSLEYLPEILGEMENIRELSFQWCESLVAVDESIGFLKKLKILNAAGCRKLTSFPPLNLTSLETLELSHCSSLEYFPEILGEMENIKALHLERLPIKELPFSFQNLIGLREITLRRCRIVRLRCSLAMMPNLFRFQIRNCNSWQWVESEAGEEKVPPCYKP
ncbi:TMV resistance protein N-like isoform X2 [Glycine soja]|uniref:TMV resistance protein N-like isoform X2 n=1 Tax=Glycine soja TaxID=3848 RepID=UPI00103DC88F|nr:TMV resistance protein N-like isoform X2 [Glycine soja]